LESEDFISARANRQESSPMQTGQSLPFNLQRANRSEDNLHAYIERNH
jgi:hypothetical protein